MVACEICKSIATSNTRFVSAKQLPMNVDVLTIHVGLWPGRGNHCPS